MSPKAVPSVFTYQDEDSDCDVAIQFFDREAYASEVMAISEAGGGTHND